MQLKRFYYHSGIDERDYSKIVFERKEKLDLFEELVSEGCCEELSLRTIKISRATYYRWRKMFKIYGLMGLEPDSRRPNNIRSPDWDESLITGVPQTNERSDLD